MSDEGNFTVPPDVQLQMEALRSAVRKALDRKRRLGQYAIICRDGKIIRLEPEQIGELLDADRETADG